MGTSSLMFSWRAEKTKARRKGHVPWLDRYQKVIWFLIWVIGLTAAFAVSDSEERPYASGCCLWGRTGRRGRRNRRAPSGISGPFDRQGQERPAQSVR